MLKYRANTRPIQERMNDVLLFLLAQNGYSDSENWLDALDDMFGELTEGERFRLAEACDAMLGRVWQPLPSPVR